MPTVATSRTSLSLPISELREADTLANQERLTRSELIRKALRSYRLNRKLDRIRAFGERTAAALSIDSFDDIEEIAG